MTFCALPPADGPFSSEELFDDPYLLLVPARWPRRGARLALETLSTLPLIGYRSCHTEERVESYLRGLGIDLSRVAYAGDNAIIQAMVAEGRGVALLTAAVDRRVRSADRDHEARGLGAEAAGGGRWHPEQGSSPALEAFIETAREVTRPRRERIRSAA